MENKLKNFEIIAELAQGYEGSPVIAKKLIKSAKLSNADAIKFQSVYSEISTATAKNASIEEREQMERKGYVCDRSLLYGEIEFSALETALAALV